MATREAAGHGRLRTSRACDTCNRRGRKCRPAAGAEVVACLTCAEKEIECTWDRKVKKRGAKPGHASKASQRLDRWIIRVDQLGGADGINILLRTFFEDVHPIVYILNEETFLANWEQGCSPTTRSEFARFMAVCALSSHRIAIGASDIEVAVDCGTDFMAEAVEAVFLPCHEVCDLAMHQAMHLLAVLAMEQGQFHLYHRLMGLQLSALAYSGFHDEARWPTNLVANDLDDRRKLFWHIYRLEVHTSLIVGHPVRCPEEQVSVRYASDPLTPTAEGGWITGWNVVTDVYRAMEHCLIAYRARQKPLQPYHPSLHGRETCRAEALELLRGRLVELPDYLRTAYDPESVPDLRRCGFQVANIICTYQLLRLLSFAGAGSSFDAACATVLELIEQISAVPYYYLKRMSQAMIQELSGFGHLLSGFIDERLSKTDYRQLRKVMLSMAELLDTLTSSLDTAEQPGEKLRKYVQRLDEVASEKSRTQTMTIKPVETIEHGGIIELDEHEMALLLQELEQIPWPDGLTWPTQF